MSQGSGERGNNNCIIVESQKKKMEFCFADKKKYQSIFEPH